MCGSVKDPVAKVPYWNGKKLAPFLTMSYIFFVIHIHMGLGFDEVFQVIDAVYNSKGYRSGFEKNIGIRLPLNQGPVWCAPITKNDNKKSDSVPDQYVLHPKYVFKKQSCIL